jgi:ZIP family zinc transporter
MLEVLVLSLIAGMATVAGGLIGICMKRTDYKMLGFWLGFSGGVMIVIAFMSLLFNAMSIGPHIWVAASFIGGALVMLFFDIFVPHQYLSKECSGRGKEKQDMMKVGILVILGMTLHNLPEGAVVAVGYMMSPMFGIVLAAAIAIHNIPEGLAVAAPLMCTDMSKKRILFLTAISGFAEVAGAIFAILFLSSISGLMPIALAFTGGVMVYLTMDELVPVAKKYGNSHIVSFGVITGLALMIILESLI